MYSISNISTQKMYFGLVEGEFKKQKYYNHTQSFHNGNYWNSTIFSSYVWKIKKTKKETPTLVWEIIWTSYTRWCICPREISHTHVFKSEWTLLTKRSVLVSKGAIKTNFYCKRLIVMIEGNIYIPWCPLETFSWDTFFLGAEILKTQKTRTFIKRFKQINTYLGSFFRCKSFILLIKFISFISCAHLLINLTFIRYYVYKI